MHWNQRRGGTLQVYNATGAMVETFPNISHVTSFLVKYSDAGAYLWSSRVALPVGSSTEAITVVAMDSDNDVRAGKSFMA